MKRLDEMTQERECPLCPGRRLHENILSCRINGYNIAELCRMEFLKLRDVLLDIKDTRAETIIENLIASLTQND